MHRRAQDDAASPAHFMDDFANLWRTDDKLVPPEDHRHSFVLFLKKSAKLYWGAV